MAVGAFTFGFPHLRRFDGLRAADYARKVREEADEAYDAWVDGKPAHEVAIEVMDVMQACETWLRNSGMSMGEIQSAFKEHNLKDEVRGYGG